MAVCIADSVGRICLNVFIINFTKFEEMFSIYSEINIPKIATAMKLKMKLTMACLSLALAD